MGMPPKQNKTAIINELYRSILGRDPDSSSLMYYLSLPEINEDEIRKQMIESAEHKKIISDFKSIKDLKKEIEDLKIDVEIALRSVKDKDTEIEGLNKILEQKSQEIRNVKEEAMSKIKLKEKSNNSPIITKVKSDSGFKRIIKKIIK